MGVQSVSGQEPPASVASSPARAPRPQGEPTARPNNVVQPKDKSREVRAGPEPKETQAQESTKPAIEVPDDQRAGVRMHVDSNTSRVVAQILDEMDHVIKQIPPEELLKVLAKTRGLYGLMFDQKA